MSYVDISQWGEFRVEDVFDIHSTLSGIDKSKLNQEPGDIPYITRSGGNNAVSMYVTDDQDPKYQKESGNVITVGLDTQTVCYQPVPFYTGQNVHTIAHEKFNIYNALFIVVCIKAVLRKYDWANGATLGRLKKDFVKLPAGALGDPDWAYMERYMRSVMERQGSKLGLLRRAASIERAPVNIDAWGGFRVGDLFEIKPTCAYKATNHELFSDSGTHPVVVNSMLNNGVGGYTERENTEPGQMITFSDTTSSDAIFYQPEPFVGYPHVQGLYAKGAYQDKWSEHSLLFFMACFRKVAQLRNFSYGDKFTRKLAAEFRVLLPIDAGGNPNWAYMESAMKTLLDKKAADLDALQQLLPSSEEPEVA